MGKPHTLIIPVVTSWEQQKRATYPAVSVNVGWDDHFRERVKARLHYASHLQLSNTAEQSTSTPSIS